jgi:hypothetical protein
MVSRKGNCYCPHFSIYLAFSGKERGEPRRTLASTVGCSGSDSSRVPPEYKSGALQCTDTALVTGFFHFFPPHALPSAGRFPIHLGSLCLPSILSSFYSCKMILSRATDFLDVHTHNGSRRALSRPPFPYRCFHRRSSFRPL